MTEKAPLGLLVGDFSGFFVFIFMIKGGYIAYLKSRSSSLF
jgi:hypothetical protein